MFYTKRSRAFWRVTSLLTLLNFLSTSIGAQVVTGVEHTVRVVEGLESSRESSNRGIEPVGRERLALLESSAREGRIPSPKASPEITSPGATIDSIAKQAQTLVSTGPQATSLEARLREPARNVLATPMQAIPDSQQAPPPPREESDLVNLYSLEEVRERLLVRRKEAGGRILLAKPFVVRRKAPSEQVQTNKGAASKEVSAQEAHGSALGDPVSTQGESDLQLAFDSIAAGAYVDGLISLIAVLDSVTDMVLLDQADLAIRNLSALTQKHLLNHQTVLDLSAAVSEIAAVNSPKAKEAVIASLIAQGDYLSSQGDNDYASELYLRARTASGEFIESHPSDPLVIEVIRQYVRSAELLGQGLAHEAIASLWETAQRGEFPLVSFGFRDAVANRAHFQYNNTARSFLLSLDLTAQSRNGLVEQILADDATYDWIKVQALYATGMAYWNIGEDDQALDVFGQIVENYPDLGDSTVMAAYAKARVLFMLNADRPEQCILIMKEFLDAYPTAFCADRALLDLVKAYIRADEFELALETADTLRIAHPQSLLLREIEKLEKRLIQDLLPMGLEGKLAALSPARELYSPAPLCGPFALTALLKVRGRLTTPLTLTGGAIPSNNGMSMAEMEQSAKKFGLQVLGVRVSDPDSLATPYIAHLDGNHYSLVVGRSETGFLVSSNGHAAVMVERDKFLKRWDGIALATAEPLGKFARLSSDELARIYGASPNEADYPDENRPACPNGDVKDDDDDDCTEPSDESGVPSGNDDDGGDECDRSGGDGDWQGSAGGAGIRLGGGQASDPGAAGVSSGNAGAIGTGITAGEINFKLIPRLGAQLAQQTDFYVPIRGDLALEFTRTYFNRWGIERSEIGPYGGEPWGNNIGSGWFHNYNTHVVQSTSVVGITVGGSSVNVPEGLVVVGKTATTEFIYSTTRTIGGHTHAVYAPQAQETSNVSRQELTQDTTNNEVYWNMPSGAQYHFAAPDTSSDYVGSLIGMADQSGNTLELDYDSNDRLTLVSSPQDDRSLKLEYNGNGRINVVRLKNTGGDLRVLYYYYTGAYSNALQQVSYPDGFNNTYAYDNNCNSTNTNYASYCYASSYAYISKFKDKAGNYTDFDFQYDLYQPNFLTTPHWRPEVINVYCSNGLRLETYTVVSTADTTIKLYDTAPSPDSVLQRWYQETGGISGYLIHRKFVSENPSGTETLFAQYSYDSEDNLTTTIDMGSGTGYNYTYTNTGRISTLRRGSSGPLIDLDYDANGRVVTRTDPNSAQSTYTYDAMNRISTYYHPSMGAGNVTYEYDAYGQITKVIDPLSRNWIYTFDSAGNLATSTNPLSQTVTYAYNDLGHVTQVTDPLGFDTYYEYAGSGCGGCGALAGRLTKVKNDNNTVVAEFTYTNNGDISTATDALGHVRDYDYDAMHRLTAMSDGTGNTVSYEYDLLGRPTFVAGMDGNAVEYEYNFLGQLTKISDAISDVSFAYYDNGNVSQMTDGNSNTTNFYYWNLGGLAKVEYPNSREAHYQYDGIGHLTRSGAGSDGSFDETTYSYNEGSSSSTGLLDSIEFENTFQGSTNYETVDYYYDDGGRVTQIDDWMGGSGNDGTFFTYDNADRLLTLTDYDGAFLAYTYDSAGNVVTMKDYEGHNTVYTYDNLHRAATLTAPGSQVWNVAYNNLNQVTAYNYGPSQQMTTAYGYDSRHRMTKIEHKDQSTVTDGWSYILSKGGNILQMTSALSGSKQAWDYAYDERNRLVDAIRRNESGVPQLRESYTYDGADNILTKTHVAYQAVVADDFTDTNYNSNPVWNASGTWSASGGFLQYTSGGLFPNAYTVQTEEVYDGWLSYNMGDTDPYELIWLFLAYDGTNGEVLEITGSQMSLLDFGGSPHDTNTAATTTQSQWYDLYFRVNGSKVEVWRGKQGEGMEKVLSTTSATTVTTNTDFLMLTGSEGSQFDNFRIMKPRSGALSFTDDFSDGEYSSNPTWTSHSGTWSAGSSYMQNTAHASLYPGFRKDFATTDFDLKYRFRINSTGTTSSDPRAYAVLRGQTSGSANNIEVNFIKNSNQLRLGQYSNGSFSTLVSNTSLSIAYDTDYDVQVVADGRHIEVWWAQGGQEMTKIAETDSATVLSGGRIILGTQPNTVARYDNFEFTTPDPKTSTYTYGYGNQLMTMVDGGTTSTYTYDAWGRQATKTVGGNSAYYRYRYGDTLKRITSSIPGEPSAVSYIVDSQKHLRKREVFQNDASTLTEEKWYRWEGWEELAEYDQGGGGTWDIGTLNKRYVPGLAEVHGSNPSSGTYRHHQTDHLGSVRAVRDGTSKALLARYDYMPYGESRVASGMALNKGFTGHTWDPALKQYHAPFRWYNPAAGRWNMRDPLGYVDGPNVYGYVGGNPVMYSDRLGLDRTVCFSWHTWIRVDDPKNPGKQWDLHFNFFGYYKERPTKEYDTILPSFKTTYGSVPHEDEQLIDRWDKYIEEGGPWYTGVYNCITCSFTEAWDRGQRRGGGGIPNNPGPPGSQRCY